MEFWRLFIPVLQLNISWFPKHVEVVIHYWTYVLIRVIEHLMVSKTR